MLLTGCQDSDENMSVSNKQAPGYEQDISRTPAGKNESQNSFDGITQTEPLNITQNLNTQDKRMIIRSGNINIEAENYDETEKKVKDIAAHNNGYVTNTSSSVNAQNKKQGTVTLRIPADKFDAVLTELPEIGKVMNQNITGNDITEEYVDAEARLKTQRELENRLLNLLSEKTAKLTDVVEVETKLSQVRENIERTEGRMRFLKDQASYSTLAVSIYEYSLIETSSGGGFFYELGEAFRKGLQGFTKVISGIITVFIALIPLLIIVAVIIYFVRWYLRRRKLRISAH
jgi:hypothetical protein